MIRAGQATSRPAGDAAAKLTAEMKEVMAKNIESLLAEDVERMAATVHPNSPMYSRTKRTLTRVMARYDLKYELLAFDYVGRDEDYAVARTKQKTTRLAGPAFRDNIVDAMQISRQDAGVWKWWHTAVLEIEYLQQQGAAGK